MPGDELQVAAPEQCADAQVDQVRRAAVAKQGKGDRRRGDDRAESGGRYEDEYRGGRLYPGDRNQRDASPVTDSSRQQEDHVRSRQQNQGDGSGREREQRRGRRHAATVSPGTERVSTDYLPGALAANPILE